MPAPYSAGSIFLQVVPSFRGVPEKIAREARDNWADAASKPFDKRFEENVQKSIPKALEKGFKGAEQASGRAGDDAGEKYSGAFRDSVRKGIAAAQRELKGLKVKLDDSELQHQVELIKTGLKGLDRNIKMGANAGSAFITLQRLAAKVEDIQDKAGNIEARASLGSVHRGLDGVAAHIKALSGMTIEPDLKIDKQLGAFERGIRSAVDNALRDLGTVDVGAKSNAGQRAVAELRRQLLELSDLDIGVDISAETFRARMESIRDELMQITREHWSVDLDANTTAAAGALDSILVKMEAIDGRSVDIDVDVKDAASAITVLRTLEKQSDHTRAAVHGLNHEVGQDGANAFRAFNVRVLGVAALGPLVVPAIGGIAGAIAALGPLAAAAGAGLGVLTLGLFGLGDAFKALQGVRDSAGKDLEAYRTKVTSASRSVADAERGLAQARADAAQASEDASMRVADALRGVEDAERNLRDAQRDSRQAQEDLTDARREAEEQLQDLQLKVRDGALDERQAVLDLHQAQDDLNAARAAGVSGDELEQLILDYDRAKLRIDQTKEANQDLTAEQQKWARTGIEGSDVVVAAQERVRASQEQIADAERGLADAQRDVARARQEQSRTAIDGQRSVADAQRTLIRAQQDYQTALADTSSSQQKLTTEMAKLGPAGQAFVTWLDSLRPRLQHLRNIAQAGFLPGLQNWLDALINNPYIDRGIERISSALGHMFDDFAESIRGPAFSGLFDMINRSGPRFLGYMSDILVNLGEGVAYLITAMEPLGDLFGTWLVDATQRFSDWAAGLKGSTGLREFFEYVERIGPKIADFVWQLARALLAIGQAIAPFAEGLLEMFTDLFAWIADMDPTNLRNITLLILGLTVALQGIFGLTALVHSFRSAFRLVAEVVERFGKSGLAFLGPWFVLGAALFVLYQNSENFRKALQTLWHEVLEPLFGFLGDFLAAVIEPLFHFLGDNIEIVATIAAAWASWKIILQVIGWIGALRTALGKLAVAQALVAATGGGGLMTGPGDARRGVGAQGGRLGGLIGVGAAGLGIGAALAGVGFASNIASDEVDQHRSVFDQLFANIRQGGRNASGSQTIVEGLRGQLADESGIGRFGRGLRDLFLPGQDELTTFEQSDKAFRDQFAALTPLEQAQAKVAEWTNTLADRQRTLGETSDKTTAAHRRLEYWTHQVETRQRDLADASSGLNTELLEQQGLAIALADADIAYAQSKDALDQAFQNYRDTLNDVNATDEERRAAEEQWTNQSRQTAEAARQVAQARHLNADAATKEAYGNAALLIDLERQKEVYGTLPPRLEELRASLAATVDPTILAAAEMENLGLSVVSVPDSKSIIIDSTTPEQIQHLEDLGLHVEQLPDGTFKVTANTDAAAATLDEFIKTQREINIGARVDWALDRALRKPTTRNYGDAGFGDAGFARGGAVFGPGTWTSDSIPAWLSHGEYVVRAASVAKYGLEFFDALNEGRLGREATGFSRGGRARRKQGLPAFQDGGLAVNWGGSMSLTGGDVGPLAAMWWQAVAQINAAAQTGVRIMAKTLGSFSVMTNRSFGSIAVGVTIAWTRLMISLTQATAKMVADQLLQFGRLSFGIVTAASKTATSVQITWGRLAVGMATTTSKLSSDVNRQFASLAASVLRTVTSLILGIKSNFDKLPRLVASPVNQIIDKVINRGLLSAFNSIVSQLGVGKPLKGAPGVKLAAGGKVPGTSPNKRADNIPAWLTAGEYVHPVDSVDYYGPEVMEALRKRRIPRELFSTFGYASGGYVAMSNIIKKQFPWSRITSSYRPGDPGYHGAGLAIDIGGSAPYPDPTAIKQMLTINRWIASNFKNITELIHTGVGAINLWHGMPHTYDAATQAEHRNHVHWADQVIEPGSGGSFPSMPGLGLVLNPTASLNAALTKAMKGFGTTPMHNILAQVPKKLAEHMAARLDKIIEVAAVSMASDSQFAATSGSASANETLMRSMAAARGWVGAEWNALRTLIMKESGFNNVAQNPTSTAFGQFQFLNSTWAGTGIGKTSDPRLQNEAGFRYIASRYGSPSRALAFHLSHNWYRDGGPVQDVDSAGAVVPDLHDTGGWLMPGLNVVMNRTGRPEPTINPQTLDALQLIAARGGDVPLIGQYTQQVVAGSPREALDETLHQLDAAKLGGRYGRGR